MTARKVTKAKVAKVRKNGRKAQRDQKIYDALGMLTPLGKKLSQYSMKAARSALAKYAPRLDSRELRAFETLWAHSAMLPVALLIAARAPIFPEEG